MCEERKIKMIIQEKLPSCVVKKGTIRDSIYRQMKRYVQKYNL